MLEKRYGYDAEQPVAVRNHVVLSTIVSNIYDKR